MFSLFFAFVISEKFAVLFSGINTFEYYQYQADINYIYNLLLRRGFQKDHIIQFQYDDIVNYQYNPFKGQVFHTLEHINIYSGKENINFRGENVTAAQFYNTIQSLPSTSEDYVLIYHEGMGRRGILSVPDGNGKGIYADDLNKVLSEAAASGKWKNAILVVDAYYAAATAEVINVSSLLTFASSNRDEFSSAVILGFSS